MIKVPPISHSLPIRDIGRIAPLDVYIDASGGALNAQMPSPKSSNIDCTWYIYKTDSSVNTVTITTPTGSVAGQNTMSAQGDCIRVVQDTATSYRCAKIAASGGGGGGGTPGGSTDEIQINDGAGGFAGSRLAAGVSSNLLWNAYYGNAGETSFLQLTGHSAGITGVNQDNIYAGAITATGETYSAYIVEDALGPISFWTRRVYSLSNHTYSYEKWWDGTNDLGFYADPSETDIVQWKWGGDEILGIDNTGRIKTDKGISSFDATQYLSFGILQALQYVGDGSRYVQQRLHCAGGGGVGVHTNGDAAGGGYFSRYAYAYSTAQRAYIKDFTDGPAGETAEMTLLSQSNLAYAVLSARTNTGIYCKRYVSANEGSPDDFYVQDYVNNGTHNMTWTVGSNAGLRAAGLIAGLAYDGPYVVGIRNDGLIYSDQGMQTFDGGAYLGFYSGDPGAQIGWVNGPRSGYLGGYASSSRAAFNTVARVSGGGGLARANGIAFADSALLYHRVQYGSAYTYDYAYAGSGVAFRQDIVADGTHKFNFIRNTAAAIPWSFYYDTTPVFGIKSDGGICTASAAADVTLLSGLTSNYKIPICDAAGSFLCYVRGTAT